MESEIICTEIYEAALSLIGEKNYGSVDDYAERAPYLLAAFCGEARGLDAVYRSAKSLPEQLPHGAVMIELTSVFPLAKRFSGPAAMYLGAMLIIDENEELSDKLYARYCDAMSAICSEVPGAVEKITDMYGY